MKLGTHPNSLANLKPNQTTPMKLKRGRRFGRLVVIRFFGKGIQGRSIFLCKCECGKTSKVSGSNLKNGNTSSCGCLHVQRRSSARLTHGQSRRRGKGATKAYSAYTNAIGRCTNPKCERYPCYGGRGIKFLFKSFEEFFSELGPCPQNKQLDRINNNGNYEPGNVRWATRSEQMRNRRPYADWNRNK